MKEKTFEELIAGKTFIENKVYEDDDDNMVLERYDVLILLKQVREATIAEIMEKVIELNGQEFREPIKNVFDEFPTDRINLKTT